MTSTKKSHIRIEEHCWIKPKKVPHPVSDSGLPDAAGKSHKQGAKAETFPTVALLP